MIISDNVTGHIDILYNFIHFLFIPHHIVHSNQLKYIKMHKICNFPYQILGLDQHRYILIFGQLKNT
jgi:hypothetical protein